MQGTQRIPQICKNWIKFQLILSGRIKIEEQTNIMQKLEQNQIKNYNFGNR